MTTIEKNVCIPISRRLEIDLPDDMPIGEMKMTLTFSPLTQEEESASEATKEARRKELLGFAGILADDPAFARGGVAIQRELRAEWDREWDCHGDE